MTEIQTGVIKKPTLRPTLTVYRVLSFHDPAFITEAIGGCVYKLSDLNKITDVHIVKTHDSWIPTLIKDAINDCLIPDPELQEAIHRLDTI